MIVAIHQPHYLPWLRYMHKLASCDVFVILDDVQFTKQGWQNRNKIKGPQGELLLTVPVRGASFRPICDIEINTAVAWQRKHWKSLDYNYTNAPHFEAHRAQLKEIYEQPWHRLLDLDVCLIELLREALGITTALVFSSSLGVEGRGTERLLGICETLGATHYLTGAYAPANHLDAAKFARSGIEVVLQDWHPPMYRQQFPGSGFVAELSVVDLLFNEGPRSLGILLQSGKVSPQVQHTLAKDIVALPAPAP